MNDEVKRMQNVCYNCFHYAPEGRACPFCKYDPRTDEGKYRIALKPGTILVNRYLIGHVLGQGGFGITYVALDNQTKSRVAIKEYMPSEFASRDEGTVALKINSSNFLEDFCSGREQFLMEAKTLAAFAGNEHIIGIRDMFEANGTAYFAMEFVEGMSLKQYMQKRRVPLQVYETNIILLPIMEALQWVHSKGIVHRDISPDNIMIRSDGKAKLIDFGAARYSTGEKSKSLDVILKHGFAPYEQYSKRGRQGPYTDVYALAATYYYAITGKVPPDAIDRMAEDTLQLPSSYGVKIRKDTEAVLLKGLAVNFRDRYQTMTEFYTALLNSMPEPFEPDTGEEGKPAQKSAVQEKPVQPAKTNNVPPSAQTANQGKKEEKWQCLSCRNLNNGSDQYCRNCGKKRGSAGSAGGYKTDIRQQNPDKQVIVEQQGENGTRHKKKTNDLAPYFIAAAIIIALFLIVVVPSKSTNRTAPTVKPTMTNNSEQATPTAKTPEEKRADGAVSCYFQGSYYNAGRWTVAAFEPEKAITDCTGFTLHFRYDRIDSSLLGDHRVYVSVGLKNSAWIERNRVSITRQGDVYDIDITMDKARNIEGIALLPVNAKEDYEFAATIWIDSIHHEK